MKRSATSFIVFAAILLAACGTSTPSTSSTSSASSASSSASSSTSDAGGQLTITISGFTFSPNPITVPAGATVTIINSDTTAHTATSEAAAASYTVGTAPNGFSFNASLGAGATGTISVPAGLASGTVQPYFCSIHKAMMQDPNPTIVIE